MNVDLPPGLDDIADDFNPSTEVVLKATNKPDKTVETTTDLESGVETTTDTDILITTTTEADIFVGTTTESNMLLETTALADMLAETTREAEMEVDTTTEADILVSTTTEADVLSSTTTEADVFLSTATEADIALSTATEADALSTTTETDVLLSTTTETDIYVRTTTEADTLAVTITEPTRTTTEAVNLLATTTEYDSNLSTTTTADTYVATSTETGTRASTTTEADTTSESDAGTLLGETKPKFDQVTETTTKAGQELGTTTIADQFRGITTYTEQYLITTTRTDQLMDSPKDSVLPPIFPTSKALPVETTSTQEQLSTVGLSTSVSIEAASTMPPATFSPLQSNAELDDWSCTLLGELEVINTFFTTPNVGSNSSLSFIRTLTEINLGFMFEYGSNYTNRKQVKVTQIFVVENSSAYTRLRREARAYSRIKREAHDGSSTLEPARLRMKFKARRKEITEAAVQIIADLPGLVTRSLKVEGLPDCSPIGSLYGDATVNPDGCCLGELCVTPDVFDNRPSRLPLPPILSPTPHICLESCCTVSIQTSLPLMAHSITTNSLVFLLQSTTDRQTVSQVMCNSSSCRGGRSGCKQAFAVTELLAVNSAGEEFIAYVMVGSGCECSGEFVEDTSDERVADVTDDGTNIFEAIEIEEFENVLEEVRQSFSKLLAKFYLSLSKEIVTYHTGTTAGLLEKFSTFKNARDEFLSGYVQFVERSEGSLGLSLTQADFSQFQNKSISELQSNMQNLKATFDTTVVDTTEEFVNILLSLIPLFDKLENFCQLVVYSCKSQMEAEMVSKEFEQNFLKFEHILQSQIVLSIEASKELEAYYHSQYAVQAAKLLSRISYLQHHSMVDNGFVHNWKVQYVTQAARAIDIFKDNVFENKAKDLLDVLKRSLSTVFGDVRLLTECVKESYLPYYQLSGLKRMEVDNSVRGSLVTSFAPVTSELKLTIEKVSNHTENYIEDAENLLDNAFTTLQESLMEFNENVNERLNASRGLVIPVKEMKTLEEMGNYWFIPSWKGRNMMQDQDKSFIQNVQLNANLTLMEAQNDLRSKINKEKNKLTKYIVSSISDLNQVTKIKSMLEVIFDKMANSSTKALNETFNKYEALVFDQLTASSSNRTDGLDSTSFNVELDVELKANGLGSALSQADFVINSTLNEILMNTRLLVDQFLTSGDYINLLTDQAIIESLKNKNLTELLSFQSTMQVMKMWQEAQFSQLDSSIRSNLVKRESILNNFKQRMQNVLTKVTEMYPANITAKVTKRVQLILGYHKSSLKENLLSENSALLNQFFLNTKNSFSNTVGNLTTNPEVFQYLDLMVEIIQLDTMKAVEMSVRETLGQLVFSDRADPNSAGGSRSSFSTLGSLVESVGSYPTSINIPSSPDNLSAADSYQLLSYDPFSSITVSAQTVADPTEE